MENTNQNANAEGITQETEMNTTKQIEITNSDLISTINALTESIKSYEKSGYSYTAESVVEIREKFRNVYYGKVDN